MEITEVRIKLVVAKNDKLRAFCSITIEDAFVVRDLKVIEGSKGPFVAMPSRKVMQRCRKCSEKNHHRANYCNDCGGRLPVQSKTSRLDSDGTKLHADIAHPINSGCREMVQQRVLESYAEEMARSAEPGYQPTAEDYDNDDYAPAPETRGGRLGRYAEPVADNFGRSSDWEDVPRVAAEGRRGAAPEKRPRYPESSRGEPVRASSDAERELPTAPTVAFPSQNESGLAPPPSPPAPMPRDGPQSEPEDNFGAGLFS